MTSVRTIVGETTNIQNGGFIDGYGNEATGFTGTVRPVAYVALDQGRNIIVGNGIALTEAVTAVEGPKPKTSEGQLMPTPESGVYIDVQSIKAGSQNEVIEQRTFVGQFPRVRGAPATTLFTVGLNHISKDAKAGTISVRIGETRKLR